MLHYCGKYKITKRLYIIFAAILLSVAGHGQDPQFSQFYGTNLYLAPSLAGSSNGTKVTLNYRNQWPFIANGFNSYMISADHFLSKLNSGIGIMALRESAGSGKLSSTYVGAAYSYHIKINRNWSVRPGLMMSYLQRNIDFSSLVFSDQITSGTNTIEVLEAPKVRKLDFSSSAIVFNKSFWFGASYKHMSSPDIAFLGDETKLSSYYSFYAGTKIKLQEISAMFPRGQYIYPSLQFKYQGRFKQLDLGLYWELNPIMFGLRYRGIPVFKTYPGSDAVIFLAGVKKNNITVSYSYDLTISKLMGAGGGGAHEIVLIYNFKPDIRIKRKPMPCPHCHYDD